MISDFAQDQAGARSSHPQPLQMPIDFPAGFVGGDDRTVTWIVNSQSKAKSVVLTDEGEQLSDDFLRKHFGQPG